MGQAYLQRFVHSTSGVLLVGALVLVGIWVWYTWPKVTVEGVKKQLQENAPAGTSRANVEEWLKKKRIESSYSQDFRNNSTFEQNGIVTGTYSGYIVAVIRNSDRGAGVSGNIQFYILFDEKDQVARHIVLWVGTGLRS
jgi:hypothetical protein